MKKLFALVALVGLGGFVAGCGESATPPPAKGPAPMTAPAGGGMSGAPAAKPGDADKPADEKPADEKPADEKPADEKPADDEKKPE